MKLSAQSHEEGTLEESMSYKQMNFSESKHPSREAPFKADIICGVLTYTTAREGKALKRQSNIAPECGIQASISEHSLTRCSEQCLMDA
jgi:hypothetical protein